MLRLNSVHIVFNRIFHTMYFLSYFSLMLPLYLWNFIWWQNTGPFPYPTFMRYWVHCIEKHVLLVKPSDCVSWRSGFSLINQPSQPQTISVVSRSCGTVGSPVESYSAPTVEVPASRSKPDHTYPTPASPSQWVPCTQPTPWVHSLSSAY